MRSLATAMILCSSLLALSACDVDSSVLTPKPAPTFTGNWEDNSAGGQSVSETGVNSYRVVMINSTNDVVVDSSKTLSGNEETFNGGLNHYDYGKLETKTSSTAATIVLSPAMKEASKRSRLPLPVVTLKLITDDTLIWSEGGKDVVFKKVDGNAVDGHKRDFLDSVIKRDSALASFKNLLSGRKLVLVKRTKTIRAVDNSIPSVSRDTNVADIQASTPMADGTLRYNVILLLTSANDFYINSGMLVKVVPAYDRAAQAFVITMKSNDALVLRAQVLEVSPGVVQFKGAELHLPADSTGRDLVTQTTDTYEYR